jgi:homoserine dehydrogenase
MNKINVGLVGYGVVGQGVVKLLKQREEFIRNKFNAEFHIKVLCDRSYHKKDTRGLGRVLLTRDYTKILDDPSINVVIELIGGLHPAKEIIFGALNRGKHVVTANKMLIADSGKEIFQVAKSKNVHVYFEACVGAGTPFINAITDGLAGNKFSALYGIINGTCNFILSEMTQKKVSFGQALLEAQKRGYAESNPTLDITGKDSAHKLAILVYLAFGKFMKVSDIYTEGITQITHEDIEYAESLNLTIKLLGIAKKYKSKVEAHVHPTLIAKNHPLASINSIYNALFLNASPMGDILLSGEGAGQMAAASGVLSDLIHLASSPADTSLLSNLYTEAKNVGFRKMDQVKTKYYLRFMASDKPGTLSKLSGILGKHGIGINSVTQKPHYGKSTVPVLILTDHAPEKMFHLALQKIYQLSIVKSKPVAIRMESLS